MIRPLTTSLTRTLLTTSRNPAVLRQTTYASFSTTSLRPRDVIPPAVKQTAKAIDNAAAAAALKGIEVGEKVADVTRQAVGSATSSAKKTADDATVSGVDMYGDRDATVDVDSQVNAAGASAKTAAAQAKGSVSEVVGDAVGKAKEAKDQAAGQAKRMAGEASGKTSEVIGEAKGKKEEVKGRVKGSVAEERGKAGI